MIGSLVGQGLNIESAVPAAVYFHGAAGDSAAKRLGEYGMLPVDLLSEVPVVLKKFESTSSG
jgi:NAD(P)H-hydrate epimerase